MSLWRKVIVSGSIAHLNQVSASFSGSFEGDGSGLTGVIASAAPGGSNQNIQFNDNGSTSGSINFRFDKIGNFVYLTGSMIATSLTGSLQGSSSYALSSSFSSTASYALNGGGGGTNIQTIGVRIVTQDSFITEGSKGFKHIGYNSNIVKLRSIANIAGTINLNVKRSGTLLGNYNLTSASSSIDTTLTGWTTSLNANDLIEFYVSQSSTYITDITFFMDIQSI